MIIIGLLLLLVYCMGINYINDEDYHKLYTWQISNKLQIQKLFASLAPTHYYVKPKYNVFIFVTVLKWKIIKFMQFSNKFQNT